MAIQFQLFLFCFSLFEILQCSSIEKITTEISPSKDSLQIVDIFFPESNLKQNNQGAVSLSKNNEKSIQDIEEDDSDSEAITPSYLDYEYPLVPVKFSKENFTSDHKEDFEDSDEDESFEINVFPKIKTIADHDDDEEERFDTQHNFDDLTGLGLDLSDSDNLEAADEDGFDEVKPVSDVTKISYPSNSQPDKKLIGYSQMFGNHIGQIMLCLTMLVALVIVIYVVYLNNPTVVKMVRGKYQEWKSPGKTYMRLDSDIGDPLLSHKDYP